MIGDSAVLRSGATAEVFRAPAVYHEIQYFPAWVYALSAAPGIFLLSGAIRQTVYEMPFGDRPMSDAGLSVLTLVLLGLPLILYALILRMETVVDPGGLMVRFGTLGWVHRTLILEDIKSAKTVVFRPIRDFGGWGIRYGKGTWCYSTRGNRGVLVVPDRAAAPFIVGSQTAELLESALKGLIKPKP